jgi:thiol-disulfide isomerase/thioredoxin
MFSTRFCSICPSARAFFEALIGEVSGVSFYEVDAEKDLVLAKKFGVKSTPTTLVLDAGGNVMARIIGAPKRANTLAIIQKVGGLAPVSAGEPVSIVEPVSATKGANE